MNQTSEITPTDYFLSLPLKERERRVQRAYILLRTKAQEQLEVIKKIEKDGSPKDIRHIFLFTTIKEFWEDIDFLLSFGKKAKRKEKAHYPMRSAFDKMAKIAFFTRQNENRQKELARFEAFRTLKTYFEIGTRTGDSEFCVKITETYETYKEPGDPEIGSPRKNFKKGEFPDIRTCLISGKIPHPDALYNMYEDASQLSHGNYFRNLLASEDNTHFLRSAQAGLHFANEVLQGSEFHLTGSVSKEIIDIGNEYRGILSERK